LLGINCNLDLTEFEWEFDEKERKGLLTRKHSTLGEKKPNPKKRKPRKRTLPKTDTLSKDVVPESQRDEVTLTLNHQTIQKTQSIEPNPIIVNGEAQVSDRMLPEKQVTSQAELQNFVQHLWKLRHIQ